MDRIQHNSSTLAVLVSQLNALLTYLNIPIPLHSPTDLTPSLLLAILESLLAERLPLSPSLRQTLSLSPSQDQSSSTANKARNNAKIQAMKVFLGVLENDVLQRDVGLSDVDPRRLARGDWEEVVFVGELLCWVARKVGVAGMSQATVSPVLDADTAGRAEGEDVGDTSGVHTRSTSPATTITTRNSDNTNLSMHLSRREDSNTSIGTSRSYSHLHSDSFNQPSFPHLSPSSPPLSSARQLRPRCIHEIEEPSVILSPESDSTLPTRPDEPPTPENLSVYCTCPQLDPSSTAEEPSRVRYTGYIQPVDEDWELASFEATRHTVNTCEASRIDGLDTRRAGRNSTSGAGRPIAKPRGRHNQESFAYETNAQDLPSRSRPRTTLAQPTRDSQAGQTHTHAHTLALLTERARLLTEVAALSARGRSDG